MLLGYGNEDVELDDGVVFATTMSCVWRMSTNGDCPLRYCERRRVLMAMARMLMQTINIMSARVMSKQTAMAAVVIMMRTVVKLPLTTVMLPWR